MFIMNVNLQSKFIARNYLIIFVSLYSLQLFIEEAVANGNSVYLPFYFNLYLIIYYSYGLETLSQRNEPSQPIGNGHE